MDPCMGEKELPFCTVLWETAEADSKLGCFKSRFVNMALMIFCSGQRPFCFLSPRTLAGVLENWK